MQSSNPVLTRYEKNDKSGFAYDEGVSAYAQAASGGAAAADLSMATSAAAPGTGARLTINDVVVKTGLIFIVCVVFAVAGYKLVDTAPWIMWVGMIGGLVLGFVNALKKVPSPPLILLYAVLQGIFVGAISNWYNAYATSSQYGGIILQAVVATMTTFGIMLALYVTGIVKVTKRFQSVMIVALVSYMVLGLASLIAALFGVGGGWGFYGVSGIGLIICVVGVLLAAFFLMLDFEAISQGIKMGAPERESWRMAFGLLMTLIWLYLEFLRLLAIFSRN
ncbi:MAG: Bax inhibitor-1/YccA family protein [Actinomycetes bacterium]